MTKKLEMAIIISLIVISVSILNFFVLRPYRKDQLLSNCLKTTYENQKDNWKVKMEWADACVRQYK